MDPITHTSDLLLGLTALGAQPTVVGLAVICVALGVTVIALVRRELAARHRRQAETRELVRGLEELRSGSGDVTVDNVEDPELALIGDAFDRLRRSAHDEPTARRTNGREAIPAISEAAGEVAIVATDMDGDVHEFSRGATALFGYETSQVVGRPVALLFDEESFREFLPKMARRSAREAGVSSRVTLLTKDRAAFPADLTVRALPGGGFAMVVRDASELSRLERERDEAEQRYRGLIEALGDGVAIVQGGRTVFVNPAFCELSGRDARDLTGAPFRDRVAMSDVLPVAAAIAAAESSGDSRRLSAALMDADGRSTGRIRFEICRIAHEGQPAALVLAHDDSRERRLTRSLEEHETRLDAVLEASPDGIVVLAEVGSTQMVQMTNRAFVETFGLAMQDVLGCEENTLLECLAASGDGGARLAGALREGAEGTLEHAVTVGEREIELGVTRLRDRSGQDAGRLLAFRDRTRERRSENDLQAFAERLQLGKAELETSYQRLEEMHRDVEGRAERMDALNVELRRLNQMKSELLGNVSHELQTPLVSIRGYTEMILKGRLGPVSEEQRRGLSTALTNIDRLIGMIDGLLAFSRSEDELGRLHLTRFPLHPMIEEVRTLLDPKIAARSVRIEEHVDPALEVYADRDKIFRVFVNLLSNAVKFNHPGGEVKIHARAASDDRVAVRFEDSGVGIPRKAQERIFERHYRGEPGETPEAEGSGIGLSIVRDILRMHGCRIQVESEEGAGTTFTFQLPLAVVDDASDGEA